jgi:hypothetical protein
MAARGVAGCGLMRLQVTPQAFVDVVQTVTSQVPFECPRLHAASSAERSHCPRPPICKERCCEGFTPHSMRRGRQCLRRVGRSGSGSHSNTTERVGARREP